MNTDQLRRCADTLIARDNFDRMREVLENSPAAIPYEVSIRSNIDIYQSIVSKLTRGQVLTMLDHTIKMFDMQLIDAGIEMPPV